MQYQTMFRTRRKHLLINDSTPE